jgi:hypothetical protein
VVLLAIGLPVLFGWLRPAWPQSGMGFAPKLLLMDAGLYAFLVARQLEAVGYDFRFRLRDLAVGCREWAFFAPFGIGIGLGLGFIYFRRWAASGWMLAAELLVTFFFVAPPEEFYFLGLLQNLLGATAGPAARAHVALIDFRTVVLQQTFALRVAQRAAGDDRRRILRTRLA